MKLKTLFLASCLFVTSLTSANGLALPPVKASATCEYFETTYTYPSHDKYTLTALTAESQTCVDAKTLLIEQCTNICAENRDAHYCSLKSDSFTCND